MKIILSRKGFDSSNGNVASPIFPSGEMCSLPVPEPKATITIQSKRYTEITFGKWSLGTIVHDLTQGEITGEAMAHLDPDINFDSIAREANWKPVFGQSGAAERHLQNHDVKEGDVFVFYEWFKQVEHCAGTYHYVWGAPDLHVIFGWHNLAERSVCPLVIARKISGGTRSPKGYETRMGLASLFGTWMAQHLNPFYQCLATLSLKSSLGQR